VKRNIKRMESRINIAKIETIGGTDNMPIVGMFRA